MYKAHAAMYEVTEGGTRRLGVLGTLVRDTIRHPGSRRPVHAWGGIAYALTSLDAVLPPGWTLVPVIKIGHDLFAEAAAYLRSFSRIGDTGFVRRVPEANNRVELVYSTAADRVEILSGGVPGWTVRELKEILAGLDALYVNLIAGWELDLAGARLIRDRFAGRCYADLHSLFLDLEGDGHRRPRRPAHVDEWAGCFDAAQMNQDEFALFAGGAVERRANVDKALARRAATVIVTRGAEGAELLTAGEGDGPPSRRPAPLADGPARGDPTGCGDVWGATFFAGLLGGSDPEAAVARAHRMARRKLGSSGPEAFRKSLNAARPSPAAPQPGSAT